MTRIRDCHNGPVSVFVGTGDCGNDRWGPDRLRRSPPGPLNVWKT